MGNKGLLDRPGKPVIRATPARTDQSDQRAIEVLTAISEDMEKKDRGYVLD